MDFDLNDAQRGFQRALRGMCEGELGPRAEDVERGGAVPPENLQALARVGYMGLLIPESLGGNGGDMVSALLGTEEIARICPSTALVAGTTLIRFALPAILYGTQGQRERWVPPVAAGNLRGASALTEPEGGSDTRHPKTRARGTPGGYAITGEKAYVLNGPDADGILVVAAMEQEGPGDAPTAAFLVEPPRAGMSIAEGPRPVGARGARVCGLRFQDCILPAEARLGGEEGADREALERVPHTPLLVAGYAIGVGQACLEAAIQHARERATFGRPIVTYQEVHFKIADMQVNVDVARQLALRAAWLIDQRRGSLVESSVAKLFASEMASQCAHSCAHIHGGKGLAEGSRVDRLWRDSRLGEILGGTSEMHRFLIAGEVLAGRA